MQSHSRLDPKKKGEQFSDIQCYPILISLTSVTAGQISLGHGLRRIVDMFHSARDIVEENDHHLEMLAANRDGNFTSEYVRSFPIIHKS